MDLNELILDLRGHLQAILRENIELKFALDPSLCELPKDDVSIKEAIIHLAVNARESMPNGGSLTIETAIICRQTQDLKVVSNYILLRVTDTGPDAPFAKEGVFEPLYADGTEATASGPELSAVYEIVKQAGGWISIYSQQGVGSSVEIFLPCDDDSSKAA
jgi:signal transduction histidine kinase